MYGILCVFLEITPVSVYRGQLTEEGCHFSKFDGCKGHGWAKSWRSRAQSKLDQMSVETLTKILHVISHVKNICSWNISTYEIFIPRAKCQPIRTWNTQFTCELSWFKILHVKYWPTKQELHIWKWLSHVKFAFLVRNWNNLHMKYYFHMWNSMWDCRKGDQNGRQGLGEEGRNA